MTLDELRTWAAAQPDAPLTDADLVAIWQWMMRHGPASSWTNSGLLALRRVLVEVIRNRGEDEEQNAHTEAR